MEFYRQKALKVGQQR